MPFFFGKAWKERFSFHEKHIRDGFNVTFSLVRKSNQKRRFYVLFVSAKRTKKQPRGLRPSRLPGGVLAAASGRLKEKVYVIFVAAEKGN